MVKRIADAIPADIIEAELTKDRFLRKTNKANNEIYIINAQNSPNTMQEIGRLREITFRSAGGGTGESVDIDNFDTMENPCQQLIVWNPESREIIGGYRYILGENVKYDKNGQPILATSHLFHFSERFIKKYMPNTLELGRSFVCPTYQSSHAGAKSLYALDNLWDGLGALTIKYPQIKYLFGKFTMYPSFDTKGRDMILFYLKRHFGDKHKLITPHKALDFEKNLNFLEKLFPIQAVKENYKILNKEVRLLGENIPPLVNAYMNLSNTMKVFGTAINDEFGDVEETGILITIKDIYKEKKDRHIETYIKDLKSGLKLDRFGIK